MEKAVYAMLGQTPPTTPPKEVQQIKRGDLYVVKDFSLSGLLSSNTKWKTLQEATVNGYVRRSCLLRTGAFTVLEPDYTYTKGTTTYHRMEGDMYPVPERSKLIIGRGNAPGHPMILCANEGTRHQAIVMLGAIDVEELDAWIAAFTTLEVPIVDLRGTTHTLEIHKSSFASSYLSSTRALTSPALLPPPSPTHPSSPSAPPRASPLPHGSASLPVTPHAPHAAPSSPLADRSVSSEGRKPTGRRSEARFFDEREEDLDGQVHGTWAAGPRFFEETEEDGEGVVHGVVEMQAGARTMPAGRLTSSFGRAPSASLQAGAAGGKEEFVPASYDGVSDVPEVIRKARAGVLGAVKRLIDRESSAVSVEDDNGNTVLSAAASNSHVTIVELALKKGAVVDHRNNSGQTPLHLALRYGYADVAVVLMAAGADPSLRDVDGLNGAQLANPRLYESEVGQMRRMGYTDRDEVMMALLRSSGDVPAAMERLIVSAK